METVPELRSVLGEDTCQDLVVIGRKSVGEEEAKRTLKEAYTTLMTLPNDVVASTVSELVTRLVKDKQARFSRPSPCDSPKSCDQRDPLGMFHELARPDSQVTFSTGATTHRERGVSHTTRETVSSRHRRSFDFLSELLATRSWRGCVLGCR